MLVNQTVSLIHDLYFLERTFLLLISISPDIDTRHVFRSQMCFSFSSSPFCVMLFMLKIVYDLFLGMRHNHHTCSCHDLLFGVFQHVSTKFEFLTAAAAAVLLLVTGWLTRFAHTSSSCFLALLLASFSTGQYVGTTRQLSPCLAPTHCLCSHTAAAAPAAAVIHPVFQSTSSSTTVTQSSSSRPCECIIPRIHVILWIPGLVAEAVL